MFDSIRNRLILIGMLVAIAVFSLWPRNVKIRTRGADGLMHDTTERKVALKQGLDLQGGIHLGLELDQSKGKVANPSDAIDRALKGGGATCISSFESCGSQTTRRISLNTPSCWPSSLYW